MRTTWLIPVFAVMLVGAGCALTQSQNDKATGAPMSAKATNTTPPIVGVDQTLSNPSSPSGEPSIILSSPRIVQMTVADFFFDPKTVTAKPGESITIVFSGSTGHHVFTIDELGVSQSISEGGSVTITAPSTPGRYAYYCSVGAHRTLGMEGTLIVE
ncbi:MAG: cupredoxin domain-containing protein [Patescibacteria group bacterium]|jgi:plastocyanin